MNKESWVFAGFEFTLIYEKIWSRENSQDRVLLLLVLFMVEWVPWMDVSEIECVCVNV